MSTKKHRPSLPPRRPPSQGPRELQAAKATPPGSYWIYGRHAVAAALANPEREVLRVVATESEFEDISRPIQRVEPKEIDRLVGADAVHQGIAALVRPLPGYVLEDVLYKERGVLVVLDQVSDPHNVGAILRSTAAFDAAGVILPKDHSAPETAVMAKAACGGLDLVPLITVTNLASALRELKENGWWIIGLAGEATQVLSEVKPDAKTVLVLGAEGKGMRRLTQENCDFLVRLPMSARMESLNVSNAAAIALYSLFTKGRA